MFKRGLTTVVSALLALGILIASTMGSGTADARWRETPRIGVMGDEVWSAGSNGCNGSMGLGLRNDPAKPGWVELSVRSKGFTKNGCKVTLRLTFHNTVAPFNHDKYYRVSGTRKAGPLLLRKKVWIGSGFDLIAVTSTNPAQKGASWYIAIP